MDDIDQDYFLNRVIPKRSEESALRVFWLASHSRPAAAEQIPHPLRLAVFDVGVPDDTSKLSDLL